MRASRLLSVTLLFLLVGTLLFPAQQVEAGEPDGFTLRESLDLGTGTISVRAVTDMDGDGALDVVATDSPNRRMLVLEQSGGAMVIRFAFYTGSVYTDSTVADLDGDGRPDIATVSRSSPGRVWVHEAQADNSYKLNFQYTVGLYPERVMTGDTDGDGLPELMVASESFPTKISIFEAVADNTYSFKAVYSGVGGNCYFAGTADLDGDGLPETVFSDNNYRVPGYETRGSVYGYEEGKMLYRAPGAQLHTYSLGDLDGNGLGEIIGLDPATGNTKILESTGSNNQFVRVFDAPVDYSLFAIDADRDGQAELWRAAEGSAGGFKVLTLAHRSEGSLEDFYNSGDLFVGFAGDIRWVAPAGDTNADGSLELIVVQGSLVHILETGAKSAAGIFERLIEEIRNAGLAKGVENALLAKAEAAKRAYEQENSNAELHQLNALINQLDAQVGKQIPTDVADDLRDLAGSILDNMY